MLMTFPASFLADRFGACTVVLSGGSAVAIAALPLLWFTMSAELYVAFLVLGFLLPATRCDLSQSRFLDWDLKESLN